MEDNEKVFVAYSRKLLRVLMLLKKLLDESNMDKAKKLLDELIEDTKNDIQA